MPGVRSRKTSIKAPDTEPRIKEPIGPVSIKEVPPQKTLRRTVDKLGKQNARLKDKMRFMEDRQVIVPKIPVIDQFIARYNQLPPVFKGLMWSTIAALLTALQTESLGWELDPLYLFVINNFVAHGLTLAREQQIRHKASDVSASTTGVTALPNEEVESVK